MDPPVPNGPARKGDPAVVAPKNLGLQASQEPLDPIYNMDSERPHNTANVQCHQHGYPWEEPTSEKDIQDFFANGSSPELTLPFSLDTARSAQLSWFRSSPSQEKKPPTPSPYRPSEQQLLQTGKLGDSAFSARIQNTIWGVYRGEQACLIILVVDFAAKNRGLWRFRTASVEAGFEVDKAAEASSSDGRGGDAAPMEKTLAVKTIPFDSDENVNSDSEDENTSVPLILAHHPTLVRGHISHSTSTSTLGFQIPLPPPIASGGLSASYSVSRPKEGLHLIHGTLLGSPETRVKWTMKENEVSRGGIYEQPRLAVVVRVPKVYGGVGKGRFVMRVSIKAISVGGVAVVGKGGAGVRFSPKKGMEDVDLTKVDLEGLTGMKEALLGSQGPGGEMSSDTGMRFAKKAGNGWVVG